MIEMEINDLIARMVDLGFEFLHETGKKVLFGTTYGGHGVLSFDDWDTVDAFVTGQSEKMEAYGKA